MERTDEAVPLLLKRQVEEFFRTLSLFNSNKIGINELCIKAHSIKGLALFYDFKEIKEKFLDIERYLFRARSSENTSKDDIFAQLIAHKKEIEKYVDTVNENNKIEYPNSKICSFRRAKKYVFALSVPGLNSLRDLVNAINEVVLITNAIRRHNKIYLTFISNLSSTNIKMLFSSFHGELKENRLRNNIIKMTRKNLMKNLFHETKKSSELENCIYVEDFMENIYQGVLNIASEAKVKIRFRYRFNCDTISREVENALMLPLLEILKNAIAHNTEANELLIRLSIKHAGNKTILKIYNDGKKIDSKKLKNLIVNKNLLGKTQARRLSKRNAANLIFNSFVSTSNNMTIAGRGVGLFEARRLIETRGGKIEVKNCIKGLEFSIYLPRFEAISH